MKEHKYTNHLIKETSAYLLQHAHNPVNWYAWGSEALKKAKEEDKPILVSIGYAACHWCHVMERESFEDEATAGLMNEHFINIKIDREERPDIDHIYMDAVQAITGSGGWPLNVFLTPDLKPFFGGTYYPPEPAFNRSSWKQVLMGVAQAFREKRHEITEQADNLTQYLLGSYNLNINTEGFSAEHESANIIAENLVKSSDKEWGGFGKAPKFPQTFSILYLLKHAYLTRSEASLRTALLSLDKMSLGGIYDHLGGGFCRYSTDTRWQIPHFEKMLYDNALLLDAYTEAYQLTKKEEYATIINQTIEFIKREMMSPEGGFYSALDADSEGVEGKYYTWSKKEMDDLLGENSSLFFKVYNISEHGNWEHTNILWMPENLEAIAEGSSIIKDELIKSLEVSKTQLFNARQQRVRPNLDDKILTGWNALMIVSLCKAYAALANEAYLQFAQTCMAFIEKHLFNEDGGLLHSWNKTANVQPGFLDDYSAIIQAYCFLHQSTTDTGYLLKAKALMEKAIEDFSDEKDCFFYFTSKTQTDILIRKTDLYDGATPSGNSVMAYNLIVLSVFFDIPEWKKRGELMVLNNKNFIEKYPTSFGMWALNLLLLEYGLKEIVILGKGCLEVLRKVLDEYIPFKVIQASETQNNDWPLFREKIIMQNQTKIYICEEFNCLKPVETFEEFKNQLREIFNKKTKQVK